MSSIHSYSCYSETPANAVKVLAMTHEEAAIKAAAMLKCDAAMVVVRYVKSIQADEVNSQ